MLAAAGLLSQTVHAQFKFRQTPNRQDPGALSLFEEKLLWNDFLQARSVGKFLLTGSLRYRPSGSPSTAYEFTLDGDWNSFRHHSRLRMSDERGTEFSREIVIRDNAAFLIETTDGCQREVAIDGEDLSAPLIQNLPFTWNDILMPYLSWTDVVYIGPDRYLGRPAHKYIITNDSQEAPISSVVVTLDEDYAVILKSDVLDIDDNVLKRIRVSGFKQFGDEWMFSELVWEHRRSRDSVVLKVTGFDLIP